MTLSGGRVFSMVRRHRQRETLCLLTIGRQSIVVTLLCRLGMRLATGGLACLVVQLTLCRCNRKDLLCRTCRSSCSGSGNFRLLVCTRANNCDLLVAQHCSMGSDRTSFLIWAVSFASILFRRCSNARSTCSSGHGWLQHTEALTALGQHTYLGELFGLQRFGPLDAGLRAAFACAKCLRVQ